jgi:hypothetical protein
VGIRLLGYDGYWSEAGWQQIAKVFEGKYFGI